MKEGEESSERLYNDISSPADESYSVTAAETKTVAGEDVVNKSAGETTHTTGDKSNILRKLKKKFRSRKSSEDLASHFMEEENRPVTVNQQVNDSIEARRIAYQRRTTSLSAGDTSHSCFSHEDVGEPTVTFTKSTKRPRSKTFSSGLFNRVKGRKSDSNKVTTEGDELEGGSLNESQTTWPCDEQPPAGLLPQQRPLPPLPAPPSLKESQRADGVATVSDLESHQDYAIENNENMGDGGPLNEIKSCGFVECDRVPSKVPHDKWGRTLRDSLQMLSRCTWYWGPLNRFEAEEKLNGQPDGAFLVRDSSDECHLLSMSFRTNGKTFHTRISHKNGEFGFLSNSGVQGSGTVEELIERSMKISRMRPLCFSRETFFQFPVPIFFTTPVSRFDGLPSLKHLCRFVIRQNMRCCQVDELPLPGRIKEYLKGKYFLDNE